eukprot:m.324617 g.324617  ORF g.324617 m.324617 type:complete len:169 (-) comp16465_c0_seq6:1033-1539(-)
MGDGVSATTEQACPMSHGPSADLPVSVPFWHRVNFPSETIVNDEFLKMSETSKRQYVYTDSNSVATPTYKEMCRVLYPLFIFRVGREKTLWYPKEIRLDMDAQIIHVVYDKDYDALERGELGLSPTGLKRATVSVIRKIPDLRTAQLNTTICRGSVIVSIAVPIGIPR